jgi:hypothetical protein
MSEQRITGVLKEPTGMSIGWAVVMIVLGFPAAFLPCQTSAGNRTHGRASGGNPRH